MLETIRHGNLALAFALELAAVAAFGWWAYSLLQGGVMRWMLALAAAGIAVGLWGWLAAPRSTSRLELPWLALFKIAFFALAALSLAGAGHPRLAALLGGFAATQLALSGLVFNDL
ncbi:MAG TPA: DUF2568 domain-containing protein [Devosiaceae bacterium]